MNIPRNLFKFYRRAKKLKFLGSEDITELRKNRNLAACVAGIETLASQLSGYKYVIFSPSGRAAIETVVKSLHLKKDDEITTQAFGCFDVINLLSKYGKLNFCDVDLNTLNFDFSEIKKIVSKNTKVIMPVNLYGLHQPSKELIALCKQRKIVLVNDFAHDLGELIRKDKAICDVGIFSFSKGLAGPCGGLLMTNSKERYIEFKETSSKLFSYKRHGFSSWLYSLGVKTLNLNVKSNFLVSLGFLLTRISTRNDYLTFPDHREATICLSQLKKIKIIAKEYSEKYALMVRKNKSVENIRILKVDDSSVPLRVPFLYRKPIPVKEVLNVLYANGCFEPSLNYFEEYDRSLRLAPKNLPNSEYLKNHLLVAGVENLSNSDIEDLLKSLSEVTKNY